MSVEGGDYEWIGVRFVAGLFSNARVLLCNPDDDDDNPASLTFEVGEKAMSGLWQRCGGNPAAVEVCAWPSREPQYFNEVLQAVPRILEGVQSWIQLWPQPEATSSSRMRSAVPQAGEECAEPRTAVDDLQRAMRGLLDQELLLAEEDEVGISSLEAR